RKTPRRSKAWWLAWQLRAESGFPSPNIIPPGQGIYQLPILPTRRVGHLDYGNDTTSPPLRVNRARSIFGSTATDTKRTDPSANRAEKPLRLPPVRPVSGFSG